MPQVCHWRDHLHARLSPPFMCRILVLYRLGFAYKNPCAWPRQRQAFAAHFLPHLLFSCAFAFVDRLTTNRACGIIGRLSGLVFFHVSFLSPFSFASADRLTPRDCRPSHTTLSPTFLHFAIANRSVTRHPIKTAHRRSAHFALFSSVRLASFGLPLACFHSFRIAASSP